MGEIEYVVDVTEDEKIRNAKKNAVEDYKTKKLTGTWRNFARFTNTYRNPVTGEIEEQDYTGIGIPATASLLDTINYGLGLDFFFPLIFGDGSEKEDLNKYITTLKKDMLSDYLDFAQFSELMNKFGGEAGGKKGAPEGVVPEYDQKLGGKGVSKREFFYKANIMKIFESTTYANKDAEKIAIEGIMKLHDKYADKNT